ncbi:hypothetical protein IWQ62_002755 [Dispira parvispora]|uniref:Peroxin/Ferlin domain-containing protein n=1 Tax=Dispira parvispora TaxID=1520584 RepID=A0A9W8AS60_9FUNG|nr:hypothetical protein IWQ62_002755 [Dispira parvispora]
MSPTNKLLCHSSSGRGENVQESSGSGLCTPNDGSSRPLTSSPTVTSTYVNASAPRPRIVPSSPLATPYSAGTPDPSVPDNSPAKDSQHLDTLIRERYQRGRYAATADSLSQTLTMLVDDFASHLNRLLAERAAAPNEPPPLNLLTTTPKNFTQFVNRIGPIVELHNAVRNIVQWKHPWRSLEFAFGFTLLCLRPAWLVLSPFVLVLTVIARNYYARLPDLSTPSAYAANATQDSASSEVSPSNGGKGTRFWKSSGVGKPQGHKLSGPSTLFSHRPSTAVYAQNLQFIQNTMGMVCDLLDSVEILWTWLDWSDPNRTWQVVLVTILTMPLLTLAYWCIPWNYLLLFGGLGVFLGNTLWAQALVATCQPWLAYVGNRYWAKVSGWRSNMGHNLSESSLITAEETDPAYTKASNQLTEHSTVKVVVFENQRWWAGLGWIPHLLPAERSAWSDVDGTVQAQPKDHMEPLAGYTWEDSGGWQRDTTWCTKVCITDPNGWVYTDNHWKHPQANSGITVFTRRRKWFRFATIAGTRPSVVAPTQPKPVSQNLSEMNNDDTTQVVNSVRARRLHSAVD